MESARTRIRLNSEPVLAGIFVLCLLVRLVLSIPGWMLVDGGFRQTQTLIASQWMLKGSSWLTYETPVLGAPWSIPMEFPLYQGLVSIVSRLTHFGLIPSARGVSLFAFLLSLFPALSLLRRLGMERRHCWAVLSIYVLSPIYLYYSRDVLIEMFVVCLGLWSLAMTVRALEVKTPLAWAGVALLSTLCALSKITTFVGFLYASGLWVAVTVIRRWSHDRMGTLKTIKSWGIAAVLVPIVFAKIWIAYADHVKAQNPLAGFLLSGNMMHWNFGTGEQYRDVFGFLKGLFFRRSLTDAIGQRGFFLVSVALLYGAGRWRKHFWAGLLLYLSTAYTFINLYSVHDYYPVASCWFIVAGIGFFIVGWLEQEGRRGQIGFALLVLCLAGQGFEYKKHWFSKQTRSDLDWNRFMDRIRVATPEDSVLVIYGQDYSPSIPFMTGRRALMDRDNLDLKNPNFLKAVENLKYYTLGGVVACGEDDAKVLSQFGSKVAYFGFDLEPSATRSPKGARYPNGNCYFFGQRKQPRGSV